MRDTLMQSIQYRRNEILKRLAALEGLITLPEGHAPLPPRIPGYGLQHPIAFDEVPDEPIEVSDEELDVAAGPSRAQSSMWKPPQDRSSDSDDDLMQVSQPYRHQE